MRVEQVVIEDKYNKKNIKGKILEDINKSLDFGLKAIHTKLLKALDTYLSNSYYESKNKRIANLRCKFLDETIAIEILIIALQLDTWSMIQQPVGKLAAVLNYKDEWEGVRIAADLIGLAVNIDLLDIEKDADNNHTVKSRYGLDDTVIDFIRETKYLPPMIVPPKKLRFNSSCGYLTIKESIILGAGNHHEEHQALDILNILNKVRFSLDEDVLKLKEEPSKKCVTTTQKNEFNRMAKESRKVYKDLLAFGNVFYLTNKVDKRGRIYSQGYHVNIQSSEYKKALLNFTRKELII
jgi:hypothetical protein